MPISRSYLGERNQLPVDQLTAFLILPGAVFMSTRTANAYHLESGESFNLDFAGKVHEMKLVGMIEPADDVSAQTLSGLILADLATVQEITSRYGVIDRIDLILPAQEIDRLVGQIQAMLPAGVRLVETAARSGSVEEMTSAFRLNLTALSLLALVVGVFLIYNTMTYSVLRRRRLFGLMRSLGVTRVEIIRMVVTEALIVGVLGSLLGLGLGLLAGRETISMVTGTVNDLYYTTTVQPGALQPISLLKGGLLGIFATLFAALIPALEASLVPPQAALSRSLLESRTRQLVLWITPAGWILMAAGWLVIRLPGQSVYVGFGGTLLLVIGLAMQSAALLLLLMRLVRPVLGSLLGFLGRMAPSNLISNLSRTSVAAAALMVAVAVTIGMQLMVGSFRTTVAVWLEQTLGGDIYISAPSFISTNPTESIDPAVIRRVENWPGIRRLDTLRTVSVESDRGPVVLNATHNPDLGAERMYLDRAIPEAEIWQAMQEGSILVSEALVYRLGIDPSQTSLRLFTDEGWRDFPMIATIYEYTSSEGSIWMADNVYRQYWQDTGITALSLRLTEGADIEAETQDLRKELSGIQRLNIRSNSTLRSDVMEVFDRTFAITRAMQLMVTAVAFIGVLNTALLLQMEKHRESGILRALGLTGRQLRQLVMLETGLMGLAAGLMAIPTGYAIARVLVDVINQRSFGWTLQLFTPGRDFLQGVLLAVGASLLAGIYPAWQLSHRTAAETIREE